MALSASILRLSMNNKMLSKLDIKTYAHIRNQMPQLFRMIGSSSISCASKEDFMTKNKRLNRPLSPHLTIYQPQLTALLSITHRGTGMYLAGILSAFSVGMLVLPGTFPHYLEMVESMHYGFALIYLAKYSLAFPFMFHLANGIRHLAWDIGYGFDMSTLYKSGYVVLGSSLALAAVVAAL